MTTQADNESNSAVGRSRIIALDAFKKDHAQIGLENFLAKHGYPFLLLETKEGDFGEAGFQTLATKPSDATARPDAAASPHETMVPDAEKTDTGHATDVDIRPVTPVAEKHAEIAKKIGSATSAHYVCPLVKRDVNKFASMITVGRAANNDIRLNLPSVSKFHAYFTLVQSNGTWYLADANSSNGTFVNGERLKSDKNRIRLENGVALRFGPDVVARFFDSPSFYEFLQKSN